MYIIEFMYMYMYVGDSVEKGDEKGEPVDGAKKGGDEKVSTKKPGLLLLPDDNTVMQVACGMSHTGEYIVTCTCIYRQYPL